MEGGCDTFNLLVPHSSCGSTDLYDEYARIRSNVALPKAGLLRTNVAAGTQPCGTFGVHPRLPFVKSLYDAAVASFVANVGAMVEP